MKRWKNFLIKLLVTALIITGTELYWLDLSGTGEVLASVSDYVNDSYDACADLLKSMKVIDSANNSTRSKKLAQGLGVETQLSDVAITASSDKYSNVSRWNRSSQNVMNGLYTFNQKMPTATAQVKSGDWLTKSKYEAMAGTPTTEPLYITMGGTQWIVDLQYRYVNAPYTRKWNLKSNYINYRYYKIGNIEKPVDPNPVSYVATKAAEFNEDPETVIGVTAPNGKRIYNVAYNFFEGMYNPDTMKYRDNYNGTPTIPEITHTTLDGNTLKIKTYLADKFCDKNGTSFSSEEVARYDRNISQESTTADGTEILGDTEYVSPNLARAIQVKNQIYTQLKNYIKAWEEQDDNYRADQGTYDVDGIDSSASMDDKLTFMYTYLGLVRHTTKAGREQAGSGDTYKSDSILYPAIVSYLYDWKDYYLKDTMTTDYGSTHFSFADKLEDPYNHITKMLKSDYNLSGSIEPFPLYIEGIPESKLADARHPSSVPTSKSIPADLSYAISAAANGKNSSVCIALSNKDGIMKFGGKGKTPMDITSTEAKSSSTGRKYDNESWFDLPTLYYRAIYSLLLNYGSMFYLDELNSLFGGDKNSSGETIGISTEKTGINATEYNKHVNANLALIFGQGPNTKTEEHTTWLPLAEFPRGGDLDGEMDDDTDQTAHSFIENIDIGLMSSVGMRIPSYTYGVKFTIKDIASPGYNSTITSETYLVEEHKAESHTHDNIPQCPVEFKWLDCEHPDTGTCDGTNHIAKIACGNPCHKADFNKCVGPFVKIATYTDGNVYKCSTCGYESAVIPTSIDLTKEPDDSIKNTDSDPRAHVCNSCKTTTGENSWTCPLSSKKHNHYIMSGAEAVEGGGTPTLENHEKRRYTHEYTVNVESNIAKKQTYSGTASMWVESPKSGGSSDQLVQKFSNIQWLDITSYTLWHMNNGSVKGLSSILASPQNSGNVESVTGNEIVTKAVNQMGYTVYDNKLSDPTISTGSDSLARNTIFSMLGESDWASKGVIANSWNINSRGNMGYNPMVSLEQFSFGGTKGDPKTFGFKVSYNKGDTPFLRAAPSSMNVSNFINGDHSAFKIVNTSSDSTTQVVDLVYEPMSQGGRSHSTFNGFYNQALAHTFYFADLSDATGTYLSAHPKISYGNSLRVQGDYLSLNKTNDDTLTLAGMLYDTWNERFTPSDASKFSRYSSGKFSLLPNGKNKLTVFESTCRWIPARLSIIFNRNSYNNLYFEAKGITNGVDCWIIHSYCKGINGDKHEPWDGMASGTISGTGDCKGIYCSGRPLNGRTNTDKGSVNIATHNGNKSVAADFNFVIGGSECNDYVYIGTSGVKDSLSRPIRIADILSEGNAFYNQFNYADINGTSQGKAISISSNTVTVQLNHYLSEGLNKNNMMTAAVNGDGSVSTLENSMPYIGYQSKGIGTKDITIDGSGNTQKGYDPGFTSIFDPNNTYVSGGAGLDGGFNQFGTTSKEDIVVNGNKRNNAYPNSSFSINYPWLSGLNVRRHLANGYYKTGQAAVHYTSIGSQRSPINEPEHNSSGTTDKLTFTTMYIKDQPVYGGHVNDADKPNWNANGYLNSLVIFNPVSTQSAHVVTPTKYLPDASNKESFSDRKVGDRSMTFLYDHLAVKRDTRVAYKYDLNEESGEQYLSGNGIISQTTKKKDKKQKVMKKVSDLPTTAYTSKDYEVSSSETLTAGFKTSEIDSSVSSYSINQAGEYYLTRIDTPNHWISSKVRLMKNDIISFSKNSKAIVLEMGTNNFTVPWSNMKDAYTKLKDYYKANLNPEPDLKDDEIEDLDTLPDGISRKNLNQVINYNGLDTGLLMFKNMRISIGGDLKLRAGSLIKISLDVSENNKEDSSLISDALQLDMTGMPDITVTSNTKVPSGTEGNKFTYTWFLEANKETQISTIPIRVDKDCFVWHTDNILESEKVVLMSLSSNTEDDTIISDITSYDFFYTNTSYSDNSMIRKTFYNNKVVDIRGSYDIRGIDVTKEAGFYIGLNGGTTSINLKEASLNNPHKVPNTDWRFYVLGWKTSDGHLIESPIDPLLFNTATKLIIPATGKDITVSSIKGKVRNNTLSVYRALDGSYGLIDTKSSGKVSKRKSKYTGYSVIDGTFDMIQYGNDNLTQLQGYSIKSGKPWLSYEETKSIEDASLTKYSFECVFKATDGNNTSTVDSDENIAYDVKHSMYVGHRYSESLEDFWQYDWDEKTISVYDFDTEDYNSTFASALSLDDEYTIYWDNYTDLLPKESGTKSNILNTSIQLGRGWDCSVDGNGSNNLGELSSNDYWKIYKKSQSIGEPTVTNTEKWIYNKYIIFNVDMYAFTASNSSYVYDDAKISSYGNKWNPTTPAFKNDGTPNKIVYIPAGEKVYLGYYNAPDTPEDDTGRFIDYGAGNNYTYHFWVPMSDGESDNNVTASYVVNSINGVTLNNGRITNKCSHSPDKVNGAFPKHVNTKNPKSTARPRLDSSESGITDEWGNTVTNAIGVYSDNNLEYFTGFELSGILNSNIIQNTKDGYTRSGNSVTTQSLSLVGRVGGLTVIDTGDPRYQDSFKQEDKSKSEDDKDYWAVAPIVRAIIEYSNKQDKPGSQKRYLTDIIDIRGRYTEHDDSCRLKTAVSVDSYNDNSWYRSKSLNNNRFKLPMTYTFNVHQELSKSLTTLKLGYEVYCTLDTIGNYYGSRGKRLKIDSDYVNNNLDYGQTKIQVHPMYVGFNKETEEFEAVDVYMKRGTSYVLINAGSKYPSKSEAMKAFESGEDSEFDTGPYYLEDCYDATYNSVIDTNSGGIVNNKYVLDQNMMRRSITDKEAKSTYNVVHNHAKNSNEFNAFTEGVTTSILDANKYDTEGIGGESLDYKYPYGNAQMLFLREPNRTFMGGTTLALNQDINGEEITNSTRYIKDTLENAQRYGQRWYFGLGLPASVVFVPHGSKPIKSADSSESKYSYVLTLIDVYAIGEKWSLHYESPISYEDINLGKPYSKDEWNLYKDTFPHNIPVNIYDLTQTTSADDQSSRGSH